ncbi:MAG: hypothetical protein IJX67_01110 [Oscillospiraceae bacterium]|nr:hypothetical protein [Oscillospiraceae bacterium]
MKPPRQNIYNAVIHRMVLESLKAKHDAFAQEHAQDTDQQLITYMRSCARQLGHAPHQKEIIGWPMITARFGTWGDALRAAKLQFPRTQNTPSQFAIMLDEIQEQKRIYRQRKSQKKLQAKQRMAEQERRKKENYAVAKKKRETALAAKE